VSKKLIIMMAAAGLVSFGGAFVLAWLTNKTAPQSVSPGAEQPTFTGEETELKLPRPEAGKVSTIGASDSEMKKAMTEKQLKRLVHEVREKMREYEGKLEGLKVSEERLQIAQDVLKKDIEELNNLRIELASMVASLKEERDKLRKSKIEIADVEKANLMSIAAAYDKMDAASAGKILSNMSKMKDDRGSSSFDDAVKILYYMTERTKAKLLAGLVGSEPEFAAALCQKLKQIIEEK